MQGWNRGRKPEEQTGIEAPDPRHALLLKWRLLKMIPIQICNPSEKKRIVQKNDSKYSIHGAITDLYHLREKKNCFKKLL